MSDSAWALSCVTHDVEAPRERVYAMISDRAFLRLASVYLMTHLFEAPLRLLFITLHTEMLLYVRDLLVLFLLGVALLSSRRGARVVPIIAFCALATFHFIVGVVTLPTLLQAVMGAKILLPLLFGMTLSPFVQRYPDTVIRFSIFAFVATAVGVAVNSMMDFPWVGLSYDTGVATVEVSRDWNYAGGIRRLPGFTRASYVAASIMLFTLVPSCLRSRSPLLRGLLVAVCTGTIIMTTTRGATTGVAVFLAFEALWLLGRAPLWSAGILALVLTCIALPSIGVGIGVPATEVASWQQSFVDRLTDMWPRAFALITDWTQVLWGRGLGGIGMGQTLGELSKFNAGDNVFVFAFITYGVLGVAYLLVLVCAAIRFIEWTPNTDLAFVVRAWLAMWLAAGLTTNMLEDIGMETIVGLVAGIALGVGGRHLVRGPRHSPISPIATVTV